MCPERTFRVVAYLKIHESRERTFANKHNHKGKENSLSEKADPETDGKPSVEH